MNVKELKALIEEMDDEAPVYVGRYDRETCEPSMVYEDIRAGVGYSHPNDSSVVIIEGIIINGADKIVETLYIGFME